MYKVYSNSNEEKVEQWMNGCEKEGYTFAGITNVTAHGFYEIVVVMKK